jgi:hypothetical protein
MTRDRRALGSLAKRRGVGDYGAMPCGMSPEEPIMSAQESRLTVSYQRWRAAIQEDDLLFVECLLADVRRLLNGGGTFIVVGLIRNDVTIRDSRHADAFAAQLRALYQP